MKIDSNGVGLEVRVEGGGVPVLLLHGWPEAKELWENQIDALASAGYKVIAPDLRGFGESDRPEGVEAYNMVNVLADVIAVLDGLNAPSAHVVGHDFGSALAWSVAAFLPDRVKRLVTMSVGHPVSLHHSSQDQHSRMWYTLLFQFDGIAEEWLSRDEWANLRTFLADHPDLDRVIANLERPGALTSTLNWYRANLPAARFTSPAIDFPPIKAPTLAIWSDRDHALLEPQMLASQQYVEGQWSYERMEDVGHFIPLEAPGRLNAILLDFLAR